MKRLRKEANGSEPILSQYRQVNYMQMLDEIISNDYIDDKLTKFLNILSGSADHNIDTVSSSSNLSPTPLSSRH
jgi:hypothetical protein